MPSSRRHRRIAAAGLVATAVAGCGGGSSSPGAAGSTSPAPSSAATTPAPTLPPGAAAPTALTGWWIDNENHALRLLLQGRQYQISDPMDHVYGKIGVRGHELFALTPQNCGSVVGDYRWSVAGNRLTLRPVKDACAARRLALGHAWSAVH